MPRVLLLIKRKKKKPKEKQKIHFNSPLRWIDRRTKSETFVKFRDEK
jgi:hypothetical protein